jgi:hypothetical protein
LIALGIACWHGSPLAGMLTYGGVVTIYLCWLGITGGSMGVLLWPAVAVHMALTILLAWAFLRST